MSAKDSGQNFELIEELLIPLGCEFLLMEYSSKKLRKLRLLEPLATYASSRHPAKAIKVPLHSLDSVEVNYQPPLGPNCQSALEDKLALAKPFAGARRLGMGGMTPPHDRLK